MTNSLYVARPYDLMGYPLMDGDSRTSLVVGETLLHSINHLLRSQYPNFSVKGDFLAFPGKDVTGFSSNELRRYYTVESFEQKIERLSERFPMAKDYLISEEAKKGVYCTFSFLLQNKNNRNETFHIPTQSMDTIDAMFTGVGLFHLGTSYR